MEKAIFFLDEIGRDDVATAGGKGANLGALVESGFPVPPGFVVSAQACQAFFESAGLSQGISFLADTPEAGMASACRLIQDRIDRAEIPADLARAVLAAHDELVGRRGAEILCAVRSSATAEDLGDASFAGQHATYYYVQRDKLLRMVKSCWASLWNPEAVSYRNTQGIDHGAVFMAVVVQEMIPSQVSGVTFTANPVTGDTDEIVTEASWGMGAAIVDGRVTPDHYVISRQGLALKEKRIADKRFMVPPSIQDDPGPRLRDVPHNRRRKETLNLEEAREVARWAIRAENHFGTAQDIEWAMVDGAFYMLQSRPITVMGHQEIGSGETGEYVIFKPLVENFTDPLTPLTWDLMNHASPPGMKLIGGRAYLYLKPLRMLLPFKMTDADLVRFIYEMGSKKPDFRLSPLKLPFFLGFLALAYLTFGVFYARTRRLPDDFMDGYRDLCRQVAADAAMGPVAAIRRLWPWYWEKLLDPAGFMVLLVNLTASRYMLFMDLLGKVLRQWIPDIGEDAESLLCSGTQGVLSAEMGRGIWELAREAKKNPTVRALLETHKPDKVLAKLREETQAKPFLRCLEQFLSVNGHRALKELELQSVRWEENPAPVLGMVRNYLLVESDPTVHEEKVAETRQALWREIRARLDSLPLERLSGFRWRTLRYLAGRTRHFAKMRENSRFYHVMGLFFVRKKILEIEKQLMEQRKLRCRDDIFYLHCHEIEKMLSGQLGWLDVEDRIRERRMEHIRLSKMAPPKTVGVKLAQEASPAPASEDADGALRGQPASPGSYEGTAHVILDPSIDIEIRPGEILVAPYTDPAWTPLFLTAGAAVVEVGSYLSHAGTVAREFGMPCVVDLPDCTKRIHTGAGVRVDGDRGMVFRVTAKGEIPA